MFQMLTLLACTGRESETPPPPVEPVVPLVEEGPLPEPRLGVVEIETPPNVVRATDIQDRASPARFDVYFDPDVTTYEALGNKLDSWGFSRVDGDGESWRVAPPPGGEWAARLLPLAEVAEVNEAVDLLAMESGAFREGSERYGDVVHTWSWREGGPVSSISGGPTPPEPMLPRALSPTVVRCIAAARTELLSGVSAGVGWERALVKEPLGWAVVFEGYGACNVSGWLALRKDGAIDTFTVAGRPAASVDDLAVWASATEYLRSARPYEDPAAQAAMDLLQKAPDNVLSDAVRIAAPGRVQELLWQALDGRSHDAALALALEVPSLESGVAAEVAELRQRTIADPKAPTEALLAAMTVWRPAPGDPPDTLARLKTHASPRVRERAWEITLDATMEACMKRLETVATATVDAASAVYRECPQQPVRMAAFNRVATLDRQLAAAMVRVVMEDPETGRTGVLAARNMAALERYDLVAELVARPTVPREMRRVGLDLMVKAKVPQAEDLVEQHGTYLGYKVTPIVTADGGK